MSFKIGSGNFQYQEASPGLLDFSRKIFEQFDVPLISLDVCFDGNQYYLIEFQVLHFGPYTLIKSPGYYLKKRQEWTYVEGKSDLETEFAISYIQYFKRKNNLT